MKKKKAPKRLRARMLAPGEMLKAADLPANARVVELKPKVGEILAANRALIEDAMNDWFAWSLENQIGARDMLGIQATFVEQRMAGNRPEYGRDQAARFIQHVVTREG